MLKVFLLMHATTVELAHCNFMKIDVKSFTNDLSLNKMALNYGLLI